MGCRVSTHARWPNLGQRPWGTSLCPGLSIVVVVVVATTPCLPFYCRCACRDIVMVVVVVFVVYEIVVGVAVVVGIAVIVVA